MGEFAEDEFDRIMEITYGLDDSLSSQIEVLKREKKRREENPKTEPEDEIMEEDEFSYHFIKVTKTCKPRTCYTKFGKMSDECHYYYDYNF